MAESYHTHLIVSIVSTHGRAHFHEGLHRAVSKDDIEAAPASIGQELVERGPTVLGAADAAIDEFRDGRPVAGAGIAPKFGELVFRFLVE